MTHLEIIDQAASLLDDCLEAFQTIGEGTENPLVARIIAFDKQLEQWLAVEESNEVVE